MKTQRSAVSLVCLVCVVAAAGAGACASRRAPEEPMTVVQNPAVPPSARAAAAERAWEGALESDADRRVVRAGFKALLWSPKTPRELRMTVLRALAEDEDPAGAADAREMARLMLPREEDREVVAYLSGAALDRGWSELTPALMRSLSRPWENTADVERPEYRAIAGLNGGRYVREVALGLFLEPPAGVGAAAGPVAEFVESPRRVRAAAWEVLCRLDTDGSVRGRLVDESVPVSADGQRLIADLRACHGEMRCLPVNGPELDWLASLRDFTSLQKRAWWEQTAAAVAGLEHARVGALELRHLEAIRWARSRRPEWIRATRQELVSELTARLEGRRHHRRSAREDRGWRPPDERLGTWARSLRWGDLLSILVLDEAIADEAVARVLFAQAEMDRADKAAEYGGLIQSARHVVAAGVAGAGQREREGFHVSLFPPRAGMRHGDDRFVASEDMIAQSDHALAHFHFHVQRTRNADYAGPSLADLAYAARYGRNCLVFTSIRGDRMNVDYYQPDGTVVDLGEIRSSVGGP